MIKKGSQQKRDLLACVEEQFNSFETVRNQHEKYIKKLFHQLDVVYRPFSRITQTIDCYISNCIKNAFCRTFSKSERVVGNPTAEQCYGCNKFFVEKKKF